MVILETRAEALQGIENVIHEMKLHVPEVASVYHATNRKTNDIVHFERINRLFWSRSIIEQVSGLNLKISLEHFSSQIQRVVPSCIVRLLLSLT